MPMSKELRLQWAAALRSGKYIQNKGHLCVFNYAGQRYYCCLGVLASLKDALELRPGQTDRMFVKHHPDYYSCTLPDALLSEYGLSRDAQQELIYSNDLRRWNFDQIADAIEAGIICGIEI